MTEGCDKKQKSFTEKLFDKLYKQYEVMPERSVLFACKKSELQKEAENKADTKKRMAIHTEYYIQLTAAYEKAAGGDEKDILRYLELVTELMLKKGKLQIFIPKDKTGLLDFIDRWNGYWLCFISDGIDAQPISTDIKDLTPAKIGRSISEIKKRLDPAGKDYVDETLEKMQKELTDKCIQRAVESYIGEKRNSILTTIDRDLVNACEEDPYFSDLFHSKKGMKDSDEEDTQAQMDLFFGFIEKGMDKETPGSEECRNIFIPLRTDRYTAVSLCIIGKNYYSDDEWEEDFPCTLAVMALNDAKGFCSGKASVIYEAESHLDEDVRRFKRYLEMAGDDKTKIRSVCDEYYTIHNFQYVEAVATARRLLRDINIKGMSSCPAVFKMSRLYSELLVKEQ